MTGTVVPLRGLGVAFVLVLLTAVLAYSQVTPMRPDTLRPHDAPAPAPGKWFVQVGAFANQENAYRLATKLDHEGYGTDLFLLVSKSRQLLCVRVGGYETVEACRAALAELRERYSLAGFMVTK